MLKSERTYEVHHTALIGEPPQMRDWMPGDPMFSPILHAGVRVGAYTCIDSGYEGFTEIGEDTYIMKQVHIGHDTIIGERCQIATGTVIAGYVIIGDDTKLGLSVVVNPFISIGSGCVIGAGSVVTKDVPDGETWYGNPATPRESKTETTIQKKWKAAHE